MINNVIENIKARYKLSFNEQESELLDRILDYAVLMHEGQMRATGEPYITHPIAVAGILLDLGLDCSTIGAAFLHDTIEDTPATENEIYSKFGEEIAQLVMGVTKLDKYTFKSKEDEAAENFRRMFFAMAKDIRIILVKLADRLHNMRTISIKARDRQVAIATETLEIYAPLASRLGLSYIKCELEDLCLMILKPDVYNSLLEEIPHKRAERQELVNKICAKLFDILNELGIQGDVSGRPKHFYSIYNKMQKQNKSFEQIYDLTAVRVIVPTVKDCYEVLGMIHTQWKPIPGRFKDYISVPKPNNYQSLHTTVMTSFGMPFEIQIRTYEMHKIAEYGIAAHWLYKENKSPMQGDKQMEWLRGMMDVQTDGVTPKEFYESLKIDLYSGMVFIFTPKGDVVELPEGSTPIDFAYSVHSEVGNRCVGAKINSKMVPLETVLQTGDYVEILTSSTSKGPSRDWLRIAKSTQAKTKIKAYFKRELKDENIKNGKEILELEAKNRGYALDDLIHKRSIDLLLQRYSFSSIEDMYASVGYGGCSANQILVRLIDFYRKENHFFREPTKEKGKKAVNTKGIIVLGHDDLLVHPARCCNPVPGDDIIGFITRGRGVVIHRKSCPNLKNAETERLIEAHWEGATSDQFVVALQIETQNSSGLLAEITRIVTDMDLSIDHLNARVDKHNNGIIGLAVNVRNLSQIEALSKKISEVSGVQKVFRCM